MQMISLCYADDLALIAPSAHALRRMLQVCSDFASERNLTFNSGKTQLICFCSHKSVVVDERFGFCEQELTFTDSVVHLCHTLSCDLSDSEDIENKTKDFIRRANCLLTNFGVCSSVVKSRLLQSFCTSFYGAAIYGNWHVLNSNYLRQHLTKYYGEFGTFHTAAIEG